MTYARGFILPGTALSHSENRTLQRRCGCLQGRETLRLEVLVGASCRQLTADQAAVPGCLIDPLPGCICPATAKG